MPRDSLAALAAVMMASVGTLQAQEPEARTTEASPGLRTRVLVGDDTARAIAHARVPGGRIVKAELETARGVLLYAFALRARGEPDLATVQVDARTGQVLSIAHAADGRPTPAAATTR